jgi:hypothetical protein
MHARPRKEHGKLSERGSEPGHPMRILHDVDQFVATFGKGKVGREPASLRAQNSPITAGKTDTKAEKPVSGKANVVGGLG